MQNLLNDLKKTLQSDERLIIDGQLVKNKVVELALAMDEGLIALLLSNDSIKKHFFKGVRGVLVFDKVAFQSFVSNKQFLPDSYTAFKNKIGLTVNKEYLTESKEVVLTWPYKDCVLEGEQTKEDQKRKEIFWNETLAPDEINRLLAPKALTNFKKYDKDGEHKVENISLDDNLIIKGNNLLALHSLKKQYTGKVKLIYIDPPYNTGSDSFGYNDSFNHSTWLTFMKNRLEIAKELLCDDGVIFIQCDDNEQAYLKVLMDEVFGQEKFLSTVISQATPNGRDYGGIAKTHEYIHIYQKQKDTFEMNMLLVKNKKFSYEDNIGKYNIHPLYNSNTNFNKGNRPNLYYPIYLIQDEKLDKNFYKLSMEKKGNSIEIFPPKSIKDNIQFVWRWGKEKSKLNINTEIMGHKTTNGYFRVVQKMRTTKKYARSIWDGSEFSNRRATEDLQKLFNGKVFATPKPEALLQRIIEIATKKGDIILDYHLGSGTTGSVAHKMQRQYIGIEQMDYIEDVSVERLKKVIGGEQGGISKDVNWKGGGSFAYCELTQHNANIIDKIEMAGTTEALKSIWQRIEKSDFISHKITPENINKNIKEFEILSLEEQKIFLIAVLDKNHLYVNYSEIDDTDYKISKEDKKLNKQFYGEA